MRAGSRSGAWFNRARPGTTHQAQSPSLPVCPWQEAARLLRGGAPRRFPLRRPLTRAWCGGGIALSHQRAGCSTVSAGGTAHARGACVLGARVDRRTAAGWAGAPSRGRPEREWARWRKPKPARDTSVRSEPSKSLGIYLIPALGRADGRSSPTIGPPHSASASRTTVGLRLRGGLEVN